MKETMTDSIHEAVAQNEYEKPHTFSLALLGALQAKPLYYGTADPAKVAKRRAKNKAAKQARKRTRRG